ncbi:hypothetical protein [Microbacterium sp. JZ31]|uniref:hypothetical protein n=1 Tax=Microbacterium sp. JZ31 TaxID=1906274 RepID=UPI0019322BAA|nr:hypothetical protein [Microbacterium sp. JZ31]
MVAALFPVAIVALVVVAILFPGTPAARVAIAAAGLVAVAQGTFSITAIAHRRQQERRSHAVDHDRNATP